MSVKSNGDVEVHYQLITQAAERNILRLNHTLRTAAERQERDFGRVQAGLDRIANTAAIMATASAAGIGLLTKAAMDAVEADNLYSVTFAKNEVAARKWADDLSKTYGRNIYSLRNYMGEFASVLKPVLGEDKAFDMSKGLTKLAYDLESFRNIPMPEVIQRLQSGMAGETEAVRKLGMDLSAATLEQVALANGIRKTGGEFTEAEKKVLRYIAMMQQAGDANDDVTRTMDSPANKLRRQQEAWGQLAVSLGTQFLPAANRLLDIGERITQWLTGLSDEQKKHLADLMLWGTGILTVVSAGAKLTSWILSLRAALATIATARALTAAASTASATSTTVDTAATAANTAAQTRNTAAQVANTAAKMANAAASAAAAAGNAAQTVTALPGPSMRALPGPVPRRLPPLAGAGGEFAEIGRGAGGAALRGLPAAGLYAVAIAGIAAVGYEIYGIAKYSKDAKDGMKQLNEEMAKRKPISDKLLADARAHADAARAAGYASQTALIKAARAGDEKAQADYQRITGRKVSRVDEEAPKPSRSLGDATAAQAAVQAAATAQEAMRAQQVENDTARSIARRREDLQRLRASSAIAAGGNQSEQLRLQEELADAAIEKRRSVEDAVAARARSLAEATAAQQREMAEAQAAYLKDQDGARLAETTAREQARLQAEKRIIDATYRDAVDEAANRLESRTLELDAQIKQATVEDMRKRITEGYNASMADPRWIEAYRAGVETMRSQATAAPRPPVVSATAPEAVTIPAPAVRTPVVKALTIPAPETRTIPPARVTIPAPQIADLPPVRIPAPVVTAPPVPAAVVKTTLPPDITLPAPRVKATAIPALQLPDPRVTLPPPAALQIPSPSFAMPAPAPGGVNGGGVVTLRIIDGPHFGAKVEAIADNRITVQFADAANSLRR